MSDCEEAFRILAKKCNVVVGHDVPVDRRVNIGGIDEAGLCDGIPRIPIRIEQDFPDDLRAGRLFAQTDMQPGVAVEDVVTAVTLDRVVAAAAQEDVASAKRYHSLVEEAGEPGDQVDVGELIERSQQLGVVCADDEVAKLRTAGPLGVCVDITDGIGGEAGRHDQLLPVQVLIDTAGGVFKGRPVEAQAA